MERYASTNGQRGEPHLWFNMCEDFLTTLETVQTEVNRYDAWRPITKKEKNEKKDLFEQVLRLIQNNRQKEWELDFIWGKDEVYWIKDYN